MDEFYIGYEPEMPDGLARLIGIVAAGLAGFAIVLASVLAAAQARFSEALFHYGEARSFEGRLVETPYPALQVAGPRGERRWHWLVGPGKHGAAPYVRGLEGRRVRVSGSLIERGGDLMIQIDPASVSTLSPASTIPPARAIGWRTVRGEIVDSKCHLGVMKPGEGPTHRDCAVRCLLGGVPPMLVVRDGLEAHRIALVAAGGERFARELPALAGRPVEVRGMLFSRGALAFLSVSASDIAISSSPDTPFRLRALLPRFPPALHD